MVAGGLGAGEGTDDTGCRGGSDLGVTETFWGTTSGHSSCPPLGDSPGRSGDRCISSFVNSSSVELTPVHERGRAIK